MARNKQGSHKLVMRVKFRIQEVASKQPDMTRTKISRLADVNYGVLNAMWQGTSGDVSLVTLLKIAKVLHADVSELYTVIDE